MIRIYGPLPPPFGGISNHIHRMGWFLDDAGIMYRVVRQGGVSKVFLIFLLFIDIIFNRPVHLHLFNKWLLVPVLLASFFRRKSKVVLTIHNDRLVGVRWFHWVLRNSRFFTILVVSKRAAKYWRVRNANPVVWMPAYVPPRRRASLEGDFRVICNVWSDYESVVWDYGLDRLVNLCRLHPDLSFHLYVGDVESESRLKSKLPKLSNLTLIFGENLADAFGPRDLFLRLNRVDAFGVSIEEALACGVYCIASNVCVRPAGAVTFRSDDELNLEFRKALQISPETRLEMISSTYRPKRYHYDLMEIYSQVLS